MRVVVLYGRSAGTIVELPYAVARTQLEAGRALPVSVAVGPEVAAIVGASSAPEKAALVEAPRKRRKGAS